jgi:hypothetical protein
VTTGVAQWVVVGVIVAVCAAYATKVLLPRGARRLLAGWLERRGLAGAAAKLDSSGGGCDACAGSGARRSGKA